jgi:hypothetical protein
MQKITRIDFDELFRKFTNGAQIKDLAEQYSVSRRFVERKLTQLLTLRKMERETKTENVSTTNHH